MSNSNTESGTESRTSFKTQRPKIRFAVICGLLMASGGFVYASCVLQSRILPGDDRAAFVQRFSGGTLMISGGGKLPLEIRERFIDLAGGCESRIVVIPSNVADNTQVESILQSWRDVGAKNVQVLQAASRDDANQTSFASALDEARGVWLGGGQQNYFAGLYAGTEVEMRLQHVLQRGGVIGGSSAGAAVMTKVMIEQGVETAQVGTGLDLLHDAVIDQHFFRRNRLNRLEGVLDQHPELMGFGIDEATALVVQLQHGRLGVLGDSYVFARVKNEPTNQFRFAIMKRGDQIDIAGLKNGVMIGSPLMLDEMLLE